MEAIMEHAPFIIGALIVGFAIKWAMDKMSNKDKGNGKLPS